MDTFPVYLRMKRKVNATTNQHLYLKDVAYVSTIKKMQPELEKIKLYSITKKDNEYAVIDCFQVLQALQHRYPTLNFQQFGVTETIVKIKHKKATFIHLKLLFAWILLFIGTAMTIMNFHDDVNMQSVQQKLHFVLTGQKVDSPLWIQIPYSLGLGLGMILFLNHWFKKRINEEPSPLEIELFTYQQDLDHYIAYYENELNHEDNAP